MHKTKWWDSKRNLPPCGECPSKCPACSDHCRRPEYLAYKAEAERIKKARNEHNLVDAYTSDQIKKNRRVW